ncbi:Undecaprenyl phosphate-alpha-4-amino-4-deoxy-L-arabinose arabinosyl transferase [Alphaproteobacteria bacterium SO-S41]|nr:Undecaprenyl phosphate-alpha-4-amino-4-deoxy-L-arabinose arabinosyl transferase [Alphaproteobacteria bacterium SO-S41]
MPSRVSAAVLFLLYVLVFLTPGFFSMPPLDRDESRFAQATKQMLETGDPVEIRFQDTARNKKPVGIYWMQAASAAALGGPAEAPIWAYRIPSAIGAVLAIFFTYLAGAALLDRRAAAIGAVLFGISVLMVAEGHIGKTDAMQTAAITAMMAGFARAFMRQRTEPGAAGRWSDTLLIGAGLGVSALIKGPVGLMVGGLAIVALWLMGGGLGWVKRTRPLLWAPLALLIVLPWAVAITLQTGWSFWYDAIWGDMLSKVAGAQEKHSGFPGYYLLLVTLTLFPGSLLLIPAAWRAVQQRKAPWAMFLIAWAVPTWLVFEILPTKLPHYVLPVYPALALAIGAYVGARFAREPDATPLAARVTGRVLWGLMVVVIAAVMFYIPHLYSGGIGFTDIAFALVVIAAATILMAIVLSDTWRLFLPGAVVLSAIALVGIFANTLGGAQDLGVSPRLAEAARAAGWTPGEPIAASGYHEPSLVFLTATDLRLVDDGAAAASFLKANPAGLAIVEGREFQSFESGVAATGIRVDKVSEIEGFNYSRGQKVDIGLYRLRPAR